MVGMAETGNKRVEEGTKQEGGKCYEWTGV